MADNLNRVLVVSPRASRSENLAKALAKCGLEMVVFDTSAGAAEALPQTPVGAALIEVAEDDQALVPLVQAIRASSAHGRIPVILVAADPGDPQVAAASAAGASEVLARSSSTQSVAETVRSRIQGDAEAGGRSLAVNSAPLPGADGHSSRKGPGELWVVCGPRGGTGRTVLASNLAVLAADSLRVALVDNVPRFGGVLMAFSLPPQTPSWVELSSLTEDEDVLDRLTRHPSGVAVLPSPSRPELADAVEPAAVGSLIFRLTKSADLVVVDQGGRLDNGGIDLLESADHMIVVGTPDNPGVLGLRYWLRICDQLGIGRDRISVVLNCVLPYHQYDAVQVTKVLGQSALVLPHGGIDGIRSLSGGEPLAWKHASNRWVKQMRTMMRDISPKLAERLKH